MNSVTLNRLDLFGKKLSHLLTSILEQPVFHNEFVVLQSLWVHFIIFILVRQIQQYLTVKELLV